MSPQTSGEGFCDLRRLGNYRNFLGRKKEKEIGSDRAERKAEAETAGQKSGKKEACEAVTAAHRFLKASISGEKSTEKLDVAPCLILIRTRLGF